MEDVEYERLRRVIVSGDINLQSDRLFLLDAFEAVRILHKRGEIQLAKEVVELQKIKQRAEDMLKNSAECDYELRNLLKEILNGSF